MKEMLGYCGWYMFGTMALMVRSQGINILLNLFFNPIVNAARAIAYQINNAINQFVNSFYNAVRPQITKLTASENREGMINLVNSSSLISFFLTCIITVPLLVEMPFVLSVWLGDVPQYTVIFSRLVIITAMIDTLGHPLTTAICASGKIRDFQIITGIILMMNLPVSYFLLKAYPHPYFVFYVSIAFAIIAQIARICFMKHMFGMSIMLYVKDVLIRSCAVFAVSFAAAYGIMLLLGQGYLSQLLVILLSVAVTMMLAFYVGLKRAQRAALLSVVVNKILLSKSKN
jgi:O-antigen/teichoic acid export membrane protein